MKLREFKDIKIVEFDDSLTSKPDPRYALYNMHLKLSDYPPPEWNLIFDAEWKSFWYSMKRKAWISGDYIIIYCVPEELEKYHKEYLETAVNAANEKYRKYSQEKARKEELQKQAEEKEKERLAEIKKRLKFD